MQAEWSMEPEDLPQWIEHQAEQTTRLFEVEQLLEDLPGIFERKFEQRLQPVLDRQQLLIEENQRLRAQVERLLPQPGEVRLRFPEARTSVPLATLDQQPLPPLLRLIRGGRPDAAWSPKDEWEDPTHR
jgi:hypothetical protein